MMPATMAGDGVLCGCRRVPVLAIGGKAVSIRCEETSEQRKEHSAMKNKTTAKSKKAKVKVQDLKPRKNPKGGNWDIPAGTASPSARR
jgi:hypothetical protein